MDMNAMKGTQSIAFSESPYLVSAGSVAGKKEGEGPLGKYFDIASEDDLFGEKTWELAEGTMQKLACKLALKNAGVQPEEVRYLFGGDLLRQGIATSMGAEELQIPVFGLFGACSTSGEALALAAMTVAAGYGDLVLAATSSHFGSAEKEFRFPLGYANQRPLSSTWTVTGSGAFLVGKKKSRVRICALAQILLDRTKMMPGRVMVSLVVLGCILGFVQIFKPLQEYAGAGVSVPLLGFGNTLWNGVKEAVDKEGFIGIFLGGFKASAAGISGALIFGYIASWIFEPKMKG